jgi:hypothetical protein
MWYYLMSNAGTGSVVVLCQFLYREDAISLIPSSIPVPLEASVLPIVVFAGM